MIVLYVCVFTFIHTHTQICMIAALSAHSRWMIVLYVCVFTLTVNMCVFCTVHTYISIYMHRHELTSYSFYTPAYMHTYMHTYIFDCVYECMCIHMCIHTHTYISSICAIVNIVTIHTYISIWNFITGQNEREESTQNTTVTKSAACASYKIIATT